MSNFIPYNFAGNTDTVSFDSVIRNGSEVTNKLILLQFQQQDSLSLVSDSINQPESIVSDYASVFSNRGFGDFYEMVQNGNNLPVIIRYNQNSDWLTIILILALILLVSVRVGFQKYISTLFQSVVNYSTSFRMFREKNYSFLNGAFRLEVLFYIVFSVFTYQILTIQQVENTNYGLLFFGKIAALIVIYFLVKKFFYRVLGIVFKSDPETSEFLFNSDNYNRATSIVLLPVTALIAYYPFGNPGIIVILGVVASGFFYLMSLRRGAIILLRKQFSIFYLFLYLCTLEFLPLFLIYKIVVE